jgi:hypothetical protein
VRLGEAFYFYSFRDEHIWVVAHECPSCVIIFNFSSWRESNDHSCRVSPQEYSELTRDSLIVYQHGQQIESGRIQHFKDNLIERFLTPVSQNLLDKIALGAARSQYIPGKLRKFFLP